MKLKTINYFLTKFESKSYYKIVELLRNYDRYSIVKLNFIANEDVEIIKYVDAIL